MELRAILAELGFEERWGVITDVEPGYLYNFGNLKLTAVQVTNQYLQPVFLFGGVSVDSRSITHVSFEMPIEVESFEQGVAWIVHGIGNRFIPHNFTHWLDQGHAWNDYLPWIRNLRAYESRPHCVVERDWWRVAAKKIRELILNAEESDLASFHFDGEVLRVKALDTVIVVPAHGKSWEHTFSIKLRNLDLLPKRLMHPLIEVGAWKGDLRLDSRAFVIVETADIGANSMKVQEASSQI